MGRPWKSGCVGCKSRGRRGGGGGAKWCRRTKSELGWAIESVQQGLKRGPGYERFTQAAGIRLVACFECKTCGNERLLGRTAIRYEGGGVLRVVHRRIALDYVTGRVKRWRDSMAEGREVLIAWEFN